MTSALVLDSERAAVLRRVLLVLAAAAGAVAGGIVLGSQEVTDFLREGPVRLTTLRGDTLQIVLGVGTLAGTAIAVLALWPVVGGARLLLTTLALGASLFLTHALLMPAVGLFALAVLVDGAGRVSRERVARFGPRRYPIPWAIGGLGMAAGVAALTWLSVWLVQPLFDEGETRIEQLTFRVDGIAPIADGAEPAETVAAAEAENEPPVGVEAAETESTETKGEPSAGVGVVETESAAAAGRSGRLIARGELMGADAFHTGSGAVLLIEAPDGSVLLRFQDYAVRNGPDLHVYLTPDPAGDVHAQGAVDLGGIKATQGSVNYDLPAHVDASTFRSAVIYCQPFAVTFAMARLE